MGTNAVESVNGREVDDGVGTDKIVVGTVPVVSSRLSDVAVTVDEVKVDDAVSSVDVVAVDVAVVVAVVAVVVDDVVLLVLTNTADNAAITAY